MMSSRSIRLTVSMNTPSLRKGVRIVFMRYDICVKSAIPSSASTSSIELRSVCAALSSLSGTKLAAATPPPDDCWVGFTDAAEQQQAPGGGRDNRQGLEMDVEGHEPCRTLLQQSEQPQVECAARAVEVIVEMMIEVEDGVYDLWQDGHAAGNEHSV